MATQIDAGYVYADDDDGVVMVGFADHQYDTKSYVLLQRDKNASDPDREEGEDKVHITVDEQDRSAYGVIAAAELRRNTMTIVLDPRGPKALRTDEEIVIRFQTDDETFDKLVVKLTDVFAREPDKLRIVEGGA